MRKTPLILLAAALPLLASCGEAPRLTDPLAARGLHCSGAAEPATAWEAGCATNHNRAVMAENASDLHVSRPETERDAMRRDMILRGYTRPGGAAAMQSASLNADAGGAAGSGKGEAQ